MTNGVGAQLGSEKNYQFTIIHKHESPQFVMLKASYGKV